MKKHMIGATVLPKVFMIMAMRMSWAKNTETK
jgi:hypothetical protein